MERTVLAIDPGTDKCGLALVRRSPDGELELKWRKIVARADVVQAMRELEGEHPFSMLIVGSGTGSKVLCTEIREAFPALGVLLVDERDTTLHARERYWEFNPRRGWRRLLPASLQVPPEPVDDFVAYILAERVLLAT